MARAPARMAAQPDQGFSWVVALCAFFANMATVTNIVTFGLLLTEFAEHFRMSLAYLSLLGAVRTGFLYMTGLLGGGLVAGLGCRTVGITGLMLAALGCLSGAYVTSFSALLATFGIITGLGGGLAYIPPAVILQQYFVRRRALATSLTSAGLSLGSMTWGLASGVLLQAQGWRPTLILMAAVNLQAIVAVAFFFDPGRGRRQSPEVKEAVHFMGNGGCAEKSQQTKEAAPAYRATADTHSCTCYLQCCDARLLSNRHFAVFAGAVMPTMGGCLAMYHLGPNRAYTQGVERLQAGYVSSAIGACALTGRVVSAFIVGRHWGPAYVQYALSAMAGGAAVMVSTLAGDVLWKHLVCAALFGLFQGNYEAVTTVVCQELAGPALLPGALGCVQAARALSSFTGLPLAGWLHDVSHGFLVPFLLLGGVQVLGGLMVLAIRLLPRAQPLELPTTQVT